jgi:hypothetical protein
MSMKKRSTGRARHGHGLGILTDHLRMLVPSIELGSPLSSTWRLIPRVHTVNMSDRAIEYFIPKFQLEECHASPEVYIGFWILSYLFACSNGLSTFIGSPVVFGSE